MIIGSNQHPLASKKQLLSAPAHITDRQWLPLLFSQDMDDMMISSRRLKDQGLGIYPATRKVAFSPHTPLVEFLLHAQPA